MDGGAGGQKEVRQGETAMKKPVIHFAPKGEDTVCGEYICGGNFHVGDIPEYYEYDGVSDWDEVPWDEADDPPIQHTCVPEFWNRQQMQGKDAKEEEENSFIVINISL